MENERSSLIEEALRTFAVQHDPANLQRAKDSSVKERLARIRQAVGSDVQCPPSELGGLEGAQKGVYRNQREQQEQGIHSDFLRVENLKGRQSQQECRE